MTLRYTSGASVVTLLTCGLIYVAPAQAQNADLLPRGESAVITVTGCLQRGGNKGQEYVLANPRLGPVANVTDGACDAAVDAHALDLDDARDHGINESLVGHWIEVSGRLEKETSTNPENLRELGVRSFRLVPVVPPQRVVTVPVPLPRSEPPAPEPAPAPALAPTVAPTAIEQPLPKTASPLAMIGLLGLLSASGSLGVRFFRSRARG
jgi:hypothetical protein